MARPLRNCRICGAPRFFDFTFERKTSRGRFRARACETCYAINENRSFLGQPPKFTRRLMEAMHNGR